MSEEFQFFYAKVNAFFRLADIIHRRSYDFLLRYDFLFRFTSTAKRQQQLIESLHDFTDKVIVARREKLLSRVSEVKENDDESFGGRRKMALLDLLLQSTCDGKSLTNLDIREEIDTFMFEVMHTPAFTTNTTEASSLIFIVRVTIQLTARLHLRFTALASTRKCNKSASTRFDASSAMIYASQ